MSRIDLEPDDDMFKSIKCNGIYGLRCNSGHRISQHSLCTALYGLCQVFLISI